MKLIRLAIERFGSVRSARVEFGRGLNVLYGPNDLGKSTLAEAIRAALLLPPGSSAHERFVEWGTDETPKVELQFQTEPAGRHWRIKKEFGSGSDAKATLASSADGQIWTVEAKGRKVDGEVRKLLSWGIPEPGGRGGTRGLPESFLTSVLLAQQTDHAAIFEQGFDKDLDESGKQLLTHALQALAQDPLFKKALDEATHRMDEAFTSTGQKKRSRGAPFKAASEAIKTTQAEHELRREELNKTREVETTIEELMSERLLAEQARDETVIELRELEQGFERQASRRALEERLEKARGELSAIEQVRQSVVDGKTDERRLQQELERAETRGKQAEALRLAVEKRLVAAREELGRLSSGDAVRERELARKTLEKEQLELQAEKTAAATLSEQARSAGTAARSAEEHRRAISELEKSVSKLRTKADALQEDKEGAEALREQLAGVALYEQWLKATTAADDARKAKNEGRKLRSQLTRMQALETELLDEKTNRALPSADDLKKLRKLHEQRIDAEARLGGGLSARVRVKRPLNITVSLDGGPEKLHRSVKQRRSFEADSEMKLDLGGVAEIELSAGEADVRAKAEKLRARWDAVGAPILAAARVRSLDKLADACREAEDRQRTAADLRRQIDELEDRVRQLETAESKADELVARAKARETALAGYDRDALEILSGRLGADRDADVERLRREAQDKASQTDRQREECARELAVQEADLKGRRSGLAEFVARHDAITADFEGEAWEAVLERASITIDEIERRLIMVTEQLEEQATEKDQAVVQAKTVVQDIEAELEQASEAAAAAAQERESALGLLAGARGELKARRQNADALDLEGARAIVKELSAELDAIEVPDPEVSEDDLAEARKRLELATLVVKDRVDQIKKLEGALEQVGGDVAKEREKMAAEAVARAKEREAELDLDYGAWRLLHETLREVESEESVHLGRALIEPISRRLHELTAGRYGSIDVEPGLKAKGIQAGGETRELDALSAGLRDQLATLFRLSVAEHLESLLVLDDQLAQTDPERVDWFGEVLRGCAERFQIIVLTCRPLEFLAENEVASCGAPVRDSAEGLLRAVDLAQIVDRAPLDAGA